MAAVGAALILIIVVLILYNIISGQRRHGNQYQNQSKSVLVKNGVDVKKQVLGGEKGEYFTGNLERHGTYYVNTKVKTWYIVFDNLNTGERIYREFVSQMRIGRSDSGPNEPVKLTVHGDERISRNHCEIYEDTGALCLQDLKSSNHTYLNGNVVTNAVYLQSGDVIRVGNTQLKVQYSIMGNRST